MRSNQKHSCPQDARRQLPKMKSFFRNLSAGLLLPILGLAISGCHVKLDEPVVNSKANAASNYVVDKNAPTATTTPVSMATKPTTGTAKDQGSTSGDDKQHKGYRRERIYQLWTIKTTK